MGSDLQQMEFIKQPFSEQLIPGGHEFQLHDALENAWVIVLHF